jgi:hypothetical protein
VAAVVDEGGELLLGDGVFADPVVVQLHPVHGSLEVLSVRRAHGELARGHVDQHVPIEQLGLPVTALVALRLEGHALLAGQDGRALQLGRAAAE